MSLLLDPVSFHIITIELDKHTIALLANLHWTLANEGLTGRNRPVNTHNSVVNY